MTPTAFTSTPIWQGASIRPQQGQRFYALHKGNIDRPANYVEVAWVDTETRQGEQVAIMLTQTGERLEWAFSDTMYRSHRQMTVASSITLPVELNPAQIKAAISALPLSDQSPDRDAIVVQNVWSAIKQHGGK